MDNSVDSIKYLISSIEKEQAGIRKCEQVSENVKATLADLVRTKPEIAAKVLKEIYQIETVHSNDRSIIGYRKNDDLLWNNDTELSDFLSQQTSTQKQKCQQR